MFQSQRPMHKWKPSIKTRVLHVMTQEIATPSQLAPKLKETQASVSVAMYELWQLRELNRKACSCGRGFVYWK